MTPSFSYAKVLLGIVLLASLLHTCAGQWGGWGGSGPEFCLEENCYEVLGVPADADGKTIKKAYRTLAVKAHPDQGGDADAFARVGRAYEVLKDEEMREDYDSFLQDPERMFYHMRRYKGWKGAPKVGVVSIVLVLVTIISVAQYFIAQNNRQMDIDRVMNNPVTKKQIKKEAEARVNLKKKSKDEIEAIMKAIAAENFPEPDPWDILWAKIILLPIALAKFSACRLDWYLRIKILKQEMTKDDKVFWISYFMGIKTQDFIALPQEEQDSWFEVEAWERANFNDEVLRLAEEKADAEKKKNPAKYKREKRWAKKMQMEGGRQWVEDE